jgi:hypothetical protein
MKGSSEVLMLLTDCLTGCSGKKIPPKVGGYPARSALERPGSLGKALGMAQAETISRHTIGQYY